MNKQLQINSIKRQIGTLMAVAGFKQVKQARSEFDIVNLQNGEIQTAGKVLGIYTNYLDFKYFFTSWENWEKILDVVWGILKHFKWMKEVFDCDQRAAFMTVISGMLFGVNTCTTVYCKVSDAVTGVFRYDHTANIIIDRDKNLYLFDADNHGMRQKITSNNVVMGKVKYEFLSIRAY